MKFPLTVRATSVQEMVRTRGLEPPRGLPPAAPQTAASTVSPRPHDRSMVPTVGLEPTLPFGNRHLKTARLPVPPHGHHRATSLLVRPEGLEPSRPRGHNALNAARLPFRHGRIPSINRSRSGAHRETRTLKTFRSHRPERCAATSFARRASDRDRSFHRHGHPRRNPPVLHHGARTGTRTPMTYRPAAFEAAASTVPPRGRHDGRGNRTRTCDFRFPKAALYHLSYSPKPDLLPRRLLHWPP